MLPVLFLHLSYWRSPAPRTEYKTPLILEIHPKMHPESSPETHIRKKYEKYTKTPDFRVFFVIFSYFGFGRNLLVAHDCGYPLSRCTCRATRVAADFLDTPPKISVSRLPPPPVPGGVAPKFGSEKVSRYTGVSQLQLRVSRYTVQLRRGFGVYFGVYFGDERGFVVCTGRRRLQLSELSVTFGTLMCCIFIGQDA